MGVWLEVFFWRMNDIYKVADNWFLKIIKRGKDKYNNKYCNFWRDINNNIVWRNDYVFYQCSYIDNFLIIIIININDINNEDYRVIR